jgi:hypothetical protein
MSDFMYFFKIWKSVFQIKSSAGNHSPAKTQYVAQESQVVQQATPYWSKYHGCLGSSTSAAEPSDLASL